MLISPGWISIVRWPALVSDGNMKLLRFRRGPRARLDVGEEGGWTCPARHD